MALKRVTTEVKGAVQLILDLAPLSALVLPLHLLWTS